MASHENKTILLVEDEVIIALAEKISLEKYGYTVITVNSGEDAVEAFKKNKNVDLILMDIDLGNGISGAEAASRILHGADVPVVFLSSHIEKDIVEKTELITSYGYVVKKSGITILDASIKMAFKLFEAKRIAHDREMALKKSETLFRTAIESLPFDFFTLDSDQKYTIQNSFCKEKWGDVVGKRPEDVTDDGETLKKWKENNLRALAGEIVKEKVTFCNKGIKENYYNIISPIIDNGIVMGILGINIDIGNQK
jgi:CheY-like chemotaxis protein